MPLQFLSRALVHPAAVGGVVFLPLEFFSAHIDDTSKTMEDIKSQYKEIRHENQAYNARNAVLTEKVVTLET